MLTAAKIPIPKVDEKLKVKAGYWTQVSKTSIVRFFARSLLFQQSGTILFGSFKKTFLCLDMVVFNIVTVIILIKIKMAPHT
ncbi:hypothetical protein BAVI_04839 [Neobacillus vireti LMG 21834]|uniref:Uncharacterized protein n=1 Tax=Neobacillus vireti LMG 21834 TaxID=1131730 RepID=A0AB94ISF0_9BACI|nr:hypothetical protein BAVI_04839 [Neobacillus vireti LMG 21834]KLT15162.1 hypothetical protein AA980_25135 [Neobacillus vireti]